MAILSIDDYGIIGNHTSLALINRLGGIDWCCLPFVDSPSHFGAILDQANGGKFQLCPQGDVRSEQRYLQRSLVLETLFETPHGRAILTDWMPLGSPPGCGDSYSSDPVIYRKIDVIEGKIAWLLTCDPRFDYGESPTEVESQGAMEQETSRWSRKHLLFRGPLAGQIAQLFSTIELEYSTFRSSGKEIAEARFTLSSGESAFFAWAWGRRVGAPLIHNGEVGTLRQTVENWRKLAHHCGGSGGAVAGTNGSAGEAAGCLFAGPWHDATAKSALFLRQLIAPYSGAIAEAATTSLKSGDYRYAWIRDSALTLQALCALGMRAEAKNHFRWLSEIVIRDGVELLQPIYTLDGGKVPSEREIKNFKGFQGMGAVRVGNDESSQFHLDIYGHVLLAADFYLREWGSLPDALWPRLEEIADFICGAWRRPDHGPWDSREKAEHYVASKALCWSALDRACAIARRLETQTSHGIEASASRWKEEMTILHRTICNQGFDPGLNSFVRSFGDTEIEASALLLPLIGFLPPDDPRIVGTVDALMSRLSEGVLLKRSLSEPPHLQSSFLLVAVLALSGQVDDASDRLAELCTFASQLGFFGEQVDSQEQETFGNFPNASAHLSLINAALYIGAARGRTLPIRHVIGMPGMPGMPGPHRREPARKIA